jgi:hypothetical protein
VRPSSRTPRGPICAYDFDRTRRRAKQHPPPRINACHHGNISVELSAHGNDGVLETYYTISHFINQTMNAFHEQCCLVKHKAKEQRKPQHTERKNDIKNVEIFEHMTRLE